MALNNSQYDTIIRSYEQKQLHNRNILDKRYETAYAKLPELKRIHQAISELSVKQARKLLEGDDNALQELKAQIKTLSKQTKDLLASGGFPADYLEPVYDCADCKDTGYIDNKKCHCFQKAVIDMLYTQSNLKHILQEENFDTFTFSYYSANHVDPKTGSSSLANMQKAYMTARDFVDTFGREFRNLFLYGDTGVGKTFLSNCIAKELIDKELHNFFKPEILNRIDEIVKFNSLNDDILIKITNKFINILKNRLLKQNIKLEFTDLAISKIIENGSNLEFGARPLKRYIQKNIETLIAKKLLEGESISSLLVDFSEDLGYFLR